MTSLKALKNLLDFNQKGWIPGPKEDEKSFLTRIETLNRFFSYPPSNVDHFLTDGDWIEAQEKTKFLYDFSPDWIVAYYSNANLTFFQGAATWITQKKDFRIPLIQLKEKFERGSLLGLYKREEVLSHEAVHVARMEFDEPLFEEILAYKTSDHFLRRILGPIFQRPWEAIVFILLLFVPLGLEIVDFFYLDLGVFSLLKPLPLAFAAFLLTRLTFFHFTLALAAKKLTPFLQIPEKKWAVILRLKDREIFSFAYRKKKYLIPFLKDQNSLRWTLLKEKYFKKI